MESKWVVPTANDMIHCITRAQSHICVSTTKMESAKTLDDMLLEVDESAVTALVGSLESQLSSSSVQNPSRDTYTSSITNNDISSTHINSSARVQQRLQNGEKASRPIVASSSSDIASGLTLASYQQTHNQHGHENERSGSDSRTISTSGEVNDTNIGLHSSIATRAINSLGASANSVMVTLTGALGLPASGYISQLQIPRPNANVRPSISVTSQDSTGLAGGRVSVNVRPASSGSTIALRPVSSVPGAIRPITISNNNMKTVYSLQQVGSELNSAINSSTNGVGTSNVRPTVRPQAKSASGVPNGNIGISGTNVGLGLNGNVIVSHSGQTVMPVVTGTTVLDNSSTNSNVTASSSSPGAVFNLANLQGNLVSQQPHVIRSLAHGTPSISQQNTSEAKQNLTGVRPIVNEQKDPKQLKDGSVLKQLSGNSHTQNLTSNVIQMNNSISVPVQAVSKAITLQSQQPVTIFNQVVTNPTVLPGVHLASVSAARPNTGTTSQKTLAPRVVLNNPVRLAPSPQVITARPGGPGIQMAGQNTITLQPGSFMRGTLLVKTENGQFQVVNLAPGPVPSSCATSVSKAPSYRLQNVQPGTQIIRTLTPQEITAALTVASPTVTMKQTTAVSATRTVLQNSTPGPTLSGVNIPQPGTTMVVSTTTSALTQPLTVQTSNITSQAASTTSQMSPNTAKKKCKNFLSTLIQLAKDQPEQVATNVKNLIQGLINGQVQAEDFTHQLQKELNSSPQPCLVPFLKKSLPHLRHSLVTGESVIDGIRPPPATAFILPTSSATVACNQITSKALVNQPSAQIRVVTQGSLSAQLAQPAGIIQQRLSADTGARFKSLLVSTNITKPSGSPVVFSTATMGTLQSKASSQTRNLAKDKKASAAVREDDDFNDVAAMGGVNLVEESQKILASNSEMVGTEIRSCKDENFLISGPLERRINKIASQHGLFEVSSDVVAIISHGTEERIKNLIERLGVIAEHRLENLKNDSRYELQQDVRGQLKFLEELDRLEKKRHEEQEREILMKAAKSRSKVEDPDKMKLKQKAKEMQRAELEEMRQREANMTALLAIGPRKKQKLDMSKTGQSSQMATGGSSLLSATSKPQLRPRVKRVNLRDLQFLMENEKDMAKGTLLYKTHLK